MPVVRTGREVADAARKPPTHGDGQEGQEPRTDTAGHVGHLPIVLIGRSMGWTGSPGWQLRLAKTLPTGLYLQGCHSHSRQPFAAGVGRWASAGDHRRDDLGRHDGRHAGGGAGRDLRRHRGGPGGRPGLGGGAGLAGACALRPDRPRGVLPGEGWLHPGGQADLLRLRGAGRVPGLRAGARRALRHLGRAVRAGAPPPAPSARSDPASTRAHRRPRRARCSSTRPPAPPALRAAGRRGRHRRGRGSPAGRR